MSSSRSLKAVLSTLLLSAVAVAARAEVERVEITSRAPCSECGTLDGVAPYEVLSGRAYFALDPNASANARVLGLKNAPRDARGKVVFATDFRVARPVKPTDSTWLYDVVNRGGPVLFGWAPNTHFLMRHGITVVHSAWAWDVAPASDEARLIFTPPLASDHGHPIKGRVANEFIVDGPTQEAQFVGINGRAYPMVIDDDPAATLTQRRRPDAPRMPIPRGAWHIVASGDGGPPTQVRLDRGFQPGVIYELTYVARDPYVVGAGMAGIRDLLAWLRANPLEGAPPPTHIVLFGYSQTGRLIQQMLYDGFDLDEQGRRVFDGAMAVVAGAGRGSFNHVFAFPTRAANIVVDRDYPTDQFPFTTGVERDPLTGRKASLLDRARAADGAVPKLFIVNNSTEFWGRAASLLETTPDGKADVPQDPDSRLYLLAGTEHTRGFGKSVNCDDPLVTAPYLRALLFDLDQWVRGQAAPPPSAYPTVAARGLVTVEEYDRLFPGNIGLTPPSAAFVPRRLDFGPHFSSDGVVSHNPPIPLQRFTVLVPRPDADGTDAVGLRAVEIQVPLGTYTGWNPQAAVTGFDWALDRFQGSFRPFARNDAERGASHDPRPSLQARYATREAFIAATRAAAERMVAERTLLAEDLDGVVTAQAAFYDRIMGHQPDDHSCTYLREARP